MQVLNIFAVKIKSSLTIFFLTEEHFFISILEVKDRALIQFLIYSFFWIKMLLMLMLKIRNNAQLCSMLLKTSKFLAI